MMLSSRQHSKNVREMALSKAQALPTRHVRDYVALDGSLQVPLKPD